VPSYSPSSLAQLVTVRRPGSNDSDGGSSLRVALPAVTASRTSAAAAAAAATAAAAPPAPVGLPDIARLVVM